MTGGAGSGISRRRFLEEVGGAAGLALLGWPKDAGRPPVGGRQAAVVGVARAATVAEAVRAAVDLAGGLDAIAPGEVVLVKPNVCCPGPHPATTSPEALAAVLELVGERDPGRVIVGDQSFFILKTAANLERTGLDRVALDAGAELVPFDDLPRVRVRPPGVRLFPEGYRVPALLSEVDHVINLACLKTHRLARFTMSLKNVIGLIDPDSRRYYHGRRRREGYDVFARMIAEMCLAMDPTMNVVEGTRAFITGGPSEGDVVEPRLVIASRDRLAADAVGLAVLRHHGTREGVPSEPAVQGVSPWEQPLIRHGASLGLGVGGPERVEVRSRGVEEIASIRGWLA